MSDRLGHPPERLTRYGVGPTSLGSCGLRDQSVLEAAVGDL